jgi:hypothetical protein
MGNPPVWPRLCLSEVAVGHRDGIAHSRASHGSPQKSSIGISSWVVASRLAMANMAHVGAHESPTADAIRTGRSSRCIRRRPSSTNSPVRRRRPQGVLGSNRHWCARNVSPRAKENDPSNSLSFARQNVMSMPRAVYQSVNSWPPRDLWRMFADRLYGRVCWPNSQHWR